MVEDNIKDFTISWVVIGFLLFCLLSFTFTFMLSNNPIGLGTEANAVLSATSTNLSGKLLRVEEEADNLLNITSKTDPEVSQLGSRDSVASAFKQRESAMGFFTSMKIFFSWVFVGEMGKMLLSVFAGLIGFTSVYFIIKWIRNGV